MAQIKHYRCEINDGNVVGLNGVIFSNGACEAILSPPTCCQQKLKGCVASPIVLEAGETFPNLILFLVSGFGPGSVKALEYYKGGPANYQLFANQSSTNNIAKGDCFDDLPEQCYLNQSIGDAASAATEISVGLKTYPSTIGLVPDDTFEETYDELVDDVNDGTIAVDVRTKEGITEFNDIVEATVVLPGMRATILQRYKQAGFNTGIITNDAIYGAGVSPMAAYATNRGDSADIMSTMVNTKPNLIMGAQSNEVDDSVGLNAGYTVISNKTEMDALSDNTRYVFGNFRNGTSQTMPSEFIPAQFAANDQPHLSEMVTKSLNILSRDDSPFLLTVNTVHISFVTAFAFGAAALIPDLLELEKSVQVAIDYAATRRDTAIMVVGLTEIGDLSVEDAGAGNTPLVTWNGAIDPVTTSYAHTNISAPLFATGPGTELFNFPEGSNKSRIYDILTTLRVRR